MMSKSEIDLRGLSLDRSADVVGAPNVRRRYLSRYVVPAILLVGFAGLLAASAGKSLLPRTSVQVVPVIVKRSVGQRDAATLFQAAGWIEPRPTSVRVAALAPGVIEQLMVVEGQLVEKNEPIAQLVRIDAELALEQAKANVAIREGELARAVAEQNAAKVRLEKPVHLLVNLADARNALAKTHTESAKLPFLIKAAEANVEFTRRSLESKQAAEDAIAGRVLDQAKSEYAAAVANHSELQQRSINLKNEAEALASKVEAVEMQLELLVEEKRQLREAEAKVQSATALRDQAVLQVRQAELTLRRTVVRAPITGRILKLLALPGTRVMGIDAVAGQDSSTVVEMYDHQSLQVRADVRLEDVPMVTPGQTVKIETASSAEVIEGRVLQVTSTANIQKNTLEVKVSLIDPPDSVRPEMLVTATFLGSAVDDASEVQTEKNRVFVPSSLIATADGDTVVWIVDTGQRAQRRTLEIGRALENGLVEVISGLTLTDKLIASDTSGLSDGLWVHIQGEEDSIGIDVNQ